MARWGIIVALLIIIGALSLISSNIVHLAGDGYYLISNAGFFSGFVHGILAPITIVLGLFIKVNMYELHNTGWWYNFGFLFGILAIWGAGKTSNNITKNYYYGYNKPTQGLSKEDRMHMEKLIDQKIEGKLKNNNKINKDIKEKNKDKDQDKKKSWEFWK
jgi:hypothetical protein